MERNEILNLLLEQLKRPKKTINTGDAKDIMRGKGSLVWQKKDAWNEAAIKQHRFMEKKNLWERKREAEWVAGGKNYWFCREGTNPRPGQKKTPKIKERISKEKDQKRKESTSNRQCSTSPNSPSRQPLRRIFLPNHDTTQHQNESRPRKRKSCREIQKKKPSGKIRETLGGHTTD